jgi:hypothetical protein
MISDEARQVLFFIIIIDDLKPQSNLNHESILKVQKQLEGYTNE